MLERFVLYEVVLEELASKEVYDDFEEARAAARDLDEVIVCRMEIREGMVEPQTTQDLR